ncbi:MAG: hypothetical protein QNK11_05350 [Legionella sp.]|nr:hypothetical protein [Legionella sp.]
MKTKYAFLALVLCVACKSHATTYYPAQILGRDLGIKGLAISQEFSNTAEHVIEMLNDIYLSLIKLRT